MKRLWLALAVVAAGLVFVSTAPAGASNPSANAHAVIGSLGPCTDPIGLTTLVEGPDDTVVVACSDLMVPLIAPGQVSGPVDDSVTGRVGPNTLVLPWGGDPTSTADDSLWMSRDDSGYQLIITVPPTPSTTYFDWSASGDRSTAWGMAIGPAGLPYVSMPDIDEIQAPASFAVLPSFVLGTGSGSQPRGLSAGDDTLYIALTGTGRLLAMNFDDTALDDSVALPNVIQVALGDDTLYALSTDDTLWQLDPATLDVVGGGITVEAIGSSGSLLSQITVDDSGGRVIVSGGGGRLTIVDQTPFAVSDTLTLPGGGAGNAGTRSGYIYAASRDPAAESIKTIAPVSVGVDQVTGREGSTLTFTVTNALGGAAPDDNTLTGITIAGTAVTALTPGDASGSSRTFTAVVPSGSNGMITAALNGGNSVDLVAFTYLSPPTPAGPPRDVTAAAGDASAVVAWSPPTSSGSFPVSTYQVIAEPAGRSCITANLTCTVTGLANGIPQSLKVRALTGAGWGAWSDAVTVTPLDRSIVLSGERSGRRIALDGVMSGFPPGAQVQVWMRTRAWGEFRPIAPKALVSEGGEFAWIKRLKRDVPVGLFAEVDGLRSNRIRLR